MNELQDLLLSDHWILSHHGDKNSVNPRIPYTWIVEKEQSVTGIVGDNLMQRGHFTRPDISSLESVLEYGIGLNSGRVFADLWDLNLYSSSTKCFDRRAERLNQMNMNQILPDPVECICGQN